MVDFEWTDVKLSELPRQWVSDETRTMWGRLAWTQFEL